MSDQRTVECRACGRTKPGRAGYCRACYDRWARAGRPDDGPPQPWTYRGEIDEMAVTRAVAGDRVPGLTPDERRIAVGILRDRGLSQRETAARLGCTMRTVERHRAALRQADRG